MYFISLSVKTSLSKNSGLNQLAPQLTIVDMANDIFNPLFLPKKKNNHYLYMYCKYQ